MKSFNYVFVLCLLMITFHCPDIEGRQLRNIFSYTTIDYENIGKSTVYENSLVVGIRDRFSFVLKGYHDKRDIWDNTIITVGPVINLDQYHYLEISFGYGQDSDKRRADYYNVELTREKPGYLFGLGFRHSVYPGYTYNTVSPSLKYYLTKRIALWGKYFLSNDSDENINNAYWVDCEVKISRHLAVRSGVTGGNRLYSPEYDSFFGGHSDFGFSSFLAQLIYTFSERFSIKYQYEQVSRQKKFTDIKNIFILDMRL